MSRHLISTTAAGKPCPGCTAPILTALDEGLTATVDAEPITGPEVQILITGRRTYTLHANNELTYRDAGRIIGGHLRGTIHAEHRCPQPTLI